MYNSTIERFLNMNTTQSEPANPHVTFTYDDIEASQYSNIQVSHFEEMQLEQVANSESYQSNEMQFSEEDCDNYKLGQLHSYFRQDKNKWKKIFKEYEGKYSIQKLKSMFKKIKNERQIWTVQEQQLLIRLIRGQVNLDEVAKEFPEKQPRSLEKMYNKLKREYFEEAKFTVKDDEKLMEMVNKFGKKWKIITKYFYGKSLNQIKNRYYSVLLKAKTGNQEQEKQKQRCGIVVLPPLPENCFYNQNTEIISSISNSTKIQKEND